MGIAPQLGMVMGSLCRSQNRTYAFDVVVLSSAALADQFSCYSLKRDLSGHPFRMFAFLLFHLQIVYLYDIISIGSGAIPV